MSGGGERPEPLSPEEVRGRAAQGAALLGARTGLVYAFGIVANLVLAGLLLPREFGVIALGMTIVIVGGYLADAGFGAALIQRSSEPVRADLEAVCGVQLALTLLIAAVCAAAAAPLGGDGLVVAAMAASLPLRVPRLPNVIVLERTLRYRTIATADVAESLVFYAWAVTAVALGMGVWGVASAAIARTAVGTAILLARGPLGLLRPRWSWQRVRPLLAFGARFQATYVLQLLREQGLNVLIAVVAGLATLGVWNLAWRVVQVPSLVFLAVGRVAFPAMARLLEAGEDSRPAIERGIAVLAAVTALAAVALVAAGPALPALIGDEWTGVPATLLWSGVALIVSAPITVVTTGYLMAAGEAGAVAIVTLASAALWFAVAALLPAYGAPAVGAAWAVAAVLNSIMLASRTSARTGAAVLRVAAPPMAVGLAAAGVAWLVAHEPDGRVLGAALGGLAGELVLLAGLAVVGRPALRDARSLARQALRGFGGRPSIRPA